MADYCLKCKWFGDYVGCINPYGHARAEPPWVCGEFKRKYKKKGVVNDKARTGNSKAC